MEVPGWKKAQEIHNKILRFARPFSVALGALGITSGVVTWKALFSRSYGQAYVGAVAVVVHAFFCWQGFNLIQLVNKRNRQFEEMPDQIAQFRKDLLQQGISKVKELYEQLPCRWKDNVSFNVLSEKELLTLIQQVEDPSRILPYFSWVPKEMSMQAPFGRICEANRSYIHSEAGIMLANQSIRASKTFLEAHQGPFWDRLKASITVDLHSKNYNTMLREQLAVCCSKPSDVPDVKTMIRQYCEEAKKLYFTQLFKTALDPKGIDDYAEYVKSTRLALEGIPHVDKALLLEAFTLALETD